MLLLFFVVATTKEPRQVRPLLLAVAFFVNTASSNYASVNRALDNRSQIFAEETTATVNL